jgi:hypothetical protein
MRSGSATTKIATTAVRQLATNTRRSISAPPTSRSPRYPSPGVNELKVYLTSHLDNGLCPAYHLRDGLLSCLSKRMPLRQYAATELSAGLTFNCCDYLRADQPNLVPSGDNAVTRPLDAQAGTRADRSGDSTTYRDRYPPVDLRRVHGACVAARTFPSSPGTAPLSSPRHRAASCRRRAGLAPAQPCRGGHARTPPDAARAGPRIPRRSPRRVGIGPWRPIPCCAP